MDGKIFYYALVLPGGGRGVPSLPVTEMLSNAHAVPDVSIFFKKVAVQLTIVYKTAAF